MCPSVVRSRPAARSRTPRLQPAETPGHRDSGTPGRQLRVRMEAETLQEFDAWRRFDDTQRRTELQTTHNYSTTAPHRTAAHRRTVTPAAAFILTPLPHAHPPRFQHRTADAFQDMCVCAPPPPLCRASCLTNKASLSPKLRLDAETEGDRCGSRGLPEGSESSRSHSVRIQHFRATDALGTRCRAGEAWRGALQLIFNC
ncbi:unnamed protein product [Pleuronectes platessa]|uniref:Uncharacterized protein n=1 Tax=Pleuronectes platessa TaxID=8262 RepID=A0A9N7UI08_PLEPL|nr:unnamed protein product [Pleuronectes platessa]